MCDSKPRFCKERRHNKGFSVENCHRDIAGRQGGILGTAAITSLSADDVFSRMDRVQIVRIAPFTSLLSLRLAKNVINSRCIDLLLNILFLPEMSPKI
jgi:hypothetical protein